MRLFAIPYDSGHRGLRMGAGPSRIERELGIAAETIEAPGPWHAEIRTSFVLYAALADRVREATAAGELPVILSGNCGAAIGTVTGVGTEGLGIVWLDAHGDFMTPETTTSGFLDGMCLAVTNGVCWTKLAATVIGGFTPVPARRSVHVGGRAWSAGEEEAMTAAGVAVVRHASDVGAALDRLAREVDRVLFHVDVDVIDPAYGRANQFACPGGLSPDEVLDVLRLTQARFTLAAVELASYDPSQDPEGGIARAGSAVIRTASERPR